MNTTDQSLVETKLSETPIESRADEVATQVKPPPPKVKPPPPQSPLTTEATENIESSFYAGEANDSAVVDDDAVAPSSGEAKSQARNLLRRMSKSRVDRDA